MYQALIKNGKQRTTTKDKNRSMISIDEGQEYALVKDLLGNGRLNVLCEDNIIRMARIRGSMRHYSKKILIEKGDLIIISKRDYEETKVDVCHKYNYDETCKLIRNNSFPQNIMKAWKTNDYEKYVNEQENEDLIFDNEEIEPQIIDKNNDDNKNKPYLDLSELDL